MYDNSLKMKNTCNWLYKLMQAVRTINVFISLRLLDTSFSFFLSSRDASVDDLLTSLEVVSQVTGDGK